MTGLTAYGCFVRFYGDVKGMIHASELGLAPGKTPSDALKVGQVSWHRSCIEETCTESKEQSLTVKLLSIHEKYVNVKW